MSLLFLVPIVTAMLIKVSALMLMCWINLGVFMTWERTVKDLHPTGNTGKLGSHDLYCQRRDTADAGRD